MLSQGAFFIQKKRGESKLAIQSVKATINGTQYTLTYNGSSGKYEASLTAPTLSSFNQSGGYYGFSVQATDEAGNVTTKNQSDATLGSSLRLVVKEKVKPTISIVSPSAGSFLTNNKPTISIQLRDNDSGVKIDTMQIKIDGGTAITHTSSGVTVTPVSGGYNITYVPLTALADGSHAITVNVSDNDGNAATQASVSFSIDTVPPSLNVSNPVNNLITNQTSITVSGVTNDVHSSPVTIAIKVGGTDQGAVTVDGSGNFSKSVPISEGSNTIEIKATDGRGLTSTVTRIVIRDTVAPEITAIELIPNPVDAGQTYVIKVIVSD